jgi:hypothetical protein
MLEDMCIRKLAENVNDEPAAGLEMVITIQLTVTAHWNTSGVRIRTAWRTQPTAQVGAIGADMRIVRCSEADRGGAGRGARDRC